MLSIATWCLACVQALHGQAPHIDSIDPAQGPIAGGTAVTINGTHFQGATLNVDKATIAPKALSDTEIRFTSPQH
ncbi:MAG: IPT/TIG domain-containing protein [Acidobacteriia bacterium]|nr:IPT/TIG domain-containing protein [Terriglobia bacterium]